MQFIGHDLERHTRNYTQLTEQCKTKHKTSQIESCLGFVQRGGIKIS